MEAVLSFGIYKLENIHVQHFIPGFFFFFGSTMLPTARQSSPDPVDAYHFTIYGTLTSLVVDSRVQWKRAALSIPRP